MRRPKRHGGERPNEPACEAENDEALSPKKNVSSRCSSTTGSATERSCEEFGHD